jgi:hypothetical protein
LFIARQKMSNIFSGKFSGYLVEKPQSGRDSLPSGEIGRERLDVRFNVCNMTQYLSRRVGKLLFPHLPRDQRKHQMDNILVVLTVSLAVAGTVALVIFRMGTKH